MTFIEMIYIVRLILVKSIEMLTNIMIQKVISSVGKISLSTLYLDDEWKKDAKSRHFTSKWKYIPISNLLIWRLSILFIFRASNCILLKLLLLHMIACVCSLALSSNYRTKNKWIMNSLSIIKSKRMTQTCCVKTICRRHIDIDNENKTCFVK